MRYGIFSDIHSNLEALESVIQAYKEESIDKYLSIGDVVGYAASPLECIEIVKKSAMITVAGNHDWASVDLFSLEYFNPEAKEAVLWTRNNLSQEGSCFLKSLKLIYRDKELTLVHSTLDNPQDFNYLVNEYAARGSFLALETDVCFIGHTHSPGVFIMSKDNQLEYRRIEDLNLEKNKKYIINAGSVGQPRDGDPRAAYCIYDTDKRQVQIKRIKYDIVTARKKIISFGLPSLFGDRLLVGR